MKDTMYITNKTNKPMRATICDDFTGGNVFTYDLKPGTNELKINSLDNGVYMMQLEDEEHTIFYEQQIVKD